MGTQRPDPADLSAVLSSLADAVRVMAEAVQGIAQAQAQPYRTSPSLPPVRLVDAVNEFLVSKARSGRSDRYLRQLRVVLAQLAQGHPGADLGDLSPASLERWATRGAWAARTRQGYLSDVRTFLAWSVRRGYLAVNPAEAVESPNPPQRPPSLHRPEDVAQVLHTAQQLDPSVCRHLALRYFSGVRSSEAHRILEADLRPGFVEVPAVKSKTRRRRLVRIRPALQAFLDMPGQLVPLSPNRVRAVIRAAGVEWPPNVTRHTWVSYALAAEESAARIALEAGHAEAVLFSTYREMTTPEEAARFWAIRPQS